MGDCNQNNGEAYNKFNIVAVVNGDKYMDQSFSPAGETKGSSE